MNIHPQKDWITSDRRSRLPSDWNRLRRKILRRDNYTCRMNLPGCDVTATEVDHIVRGDDHSESNLRAVCSRCHRTKTLREAQQAKAKKRNLRFRPQERHPGQR